MTATEHREAPATVPELLYLLHGDPTDLAEALAGMRVGRRRRSAARSSTRCRGEGHGRAAIRSRRARCSTSRSSTHYRCDIVQRMGEQSRGPADRRDVGRPAGGPLPRAARRRSAPRLLEAARRADTRRRSSCSCGIRRDTAGGIMTTEFVSVPVDVDGATGARPHPPGRDAPKKRSTRSTASTPSTQRSCTSCRCAT